MTSEVSGKFVVIFNYVVCSLPEEEDVTRKHASVSKFIKIELNQSHKYEDGTIIGQCIREATFSSAIKPERFWNYYKNE